MRTFIDFFTLSDPNIRYVVLGTMLLTSSAAIVGTFALLKKKALLGDATAHAVFPGICIAFMCTGTKHPIYLAIGAFATGWLALLLIDMLTKYSKIKEDIAIALLLSITFGIGTLLLSIIQNSANVAQVGLNNYLFGKAAALLGEDLILLSILGLIILITIGSFFKEFTLIAFDKAFAQSLGLPVSLLEFIFTSLIVLAIVIGIRAVGIVLMAAMLITPAAAARFWTDRLLTMVGLAALFGLLSGLLGSFISYIIPGMPTGPWIVLVVTTIAYVSFLFAPHKGIVARRLRQQRHQQKILQENILKLFYELGEKNDDSFGFRSIQDLIYHRPISIDKLIKGIKFLENGGFLYHKGDKWRLTGAGKNEGQRITQQHRLWELYLSKYLQIEPIYTHENAELIEHVLTPELVKELSKLLENNNDQRTK
ncbi:MAG: zinc ABC transporter permease [Candidatus Amoebophilus sp. 36-38]|nr:MAG: zinc ABC transporter permease [Candidatus Amoebophilus sp. 36-38]